MGFKALGLEACPVANAEEARETLRRLTKDSEDYAIIYVEENLAQELQHEIDKFKDVPKPAIILIPGREGPLGLGQTALKAARLARSTKAPAERAAALRQVSAILEGLSLYYLPNPAEATLMIDGRPVLALPGRVARDEAPDGER